jgi:carbamate kinase
MDRAVLIALGGNAISPEGEEGNIAQQFFHTEESMRAIVSASHGRFDRLVITHGNGPQIGNIVLRSELAAPALYPLPLDTCVSDSEGGMGYMIQQVLHNVLREEQWTAPVVSLLTQTIVSAEDQAWRHPAKFIGSFYSRDEALELAATRGWHVREDSGRGWRRVVPSPEPVSIVELEPIRALVEARVIVIAAGGGGIPVVRDARGRLQGVEAVVDKDLASGLLCADLGIETFVILTGVERVALDYRKPGEREVARMSVAECEKHLAAGQFPAGSMGPKVQAAVRFIRAGGGRVIITRAAKLAEALEGRSGTEIVA